MSIPETTSTQSYSTWLKFPEKLDSKALVGWIIKPPHELGWDVVIHTGNGPPSLLVYAVTVPWSSWGSWVVLVAYPACSLIPNSALLQKAEELRWGKTLGVIRDRYKGALRTNLLLQVKTVSGQAGSQEFNCIYFCHYFLFRAGDIGILFIAVI